MRVEPNELSDALSEGFAPTTAEKVHRLLGVLRELQVVDETRNRLTLKGGTALNVFLSERVPRLSVDLDLMVTGFPGVSAKSPDLERIVGVIGKLSTGLGYSTRRTLTDAACTLRLAYKNHLGSVDQIKLDLDFLNRITLQSPVGRQGPGLFQADDFIFQVVAPPELLGQKLTAVAYRAAERDLFDMWRMLSMGWQTHEGARASYLAYSLIQDAEWRRLDYPIRLNVDYRSERLGDVLRVHEAPPTLEEIRTAAISGLEGARPSFTAATADEQGLRRRILHGDTTAFADLLRETDPHRRIDLSNHPALRWRLRQVARTQA
jgi:predicted nucleotidyltransferase component of viral defense system